jgi:hypothetical protein
MNGRRALPPDVRDEIVRVFAAALQQVREQETELLRLSLYKLELLREGVERGRRLPIVGRKAESRRRPHAGDTKRRIPTADDRRMGARFHELRLVLRPDFAGSQAFAESLRRFIAVVAVELKRKLRDC